MADGFSAGLVVGALAGAVAGAGLAWALVRRHTQAQAQRLSALTRQISEQPTGEGALRTIADLATLRHGNLGPLSEALQHTAEQVRLRVDAAIVERNKLVAILSGMVEGVIAVDGHERVVHMNAVAGRLLDVTPAACLGRRVWEVVRVHEVVHALSQALRSNQRVLAEVRLAASPNDRALDLWAAPWSDGTGGQDGAVLVLHDTSELRRLEVIRRDFVTNVSHELKTPLTAIRGMVETVLDDPQMEAATRERFLRRVADQCERLSSLVKDLLNLARAESSNQLAEREPVELRELASSSLKALAGAAEQKRISLHPHLGSEAVSVLGDPEALRLVVDNLLNNAIKYTPQGGKVELRVRRDGPAGVLEVSDTGIGIEPADQERIFERFYRVDKARSTDMNSTGLGLAIVKHITQAHGGTVRVSSKPGVGSTFTVTLPEGGEAASV